MLAQLIIRLVLWIAFMAVLLFWPAGTLDWWGGWVFLVEMAAGATVVSLWLLRHDPELLRERLGSPIQKKQVFWDKLLMAIVFVAFYGWMVLMGFDAKRLGWSHVPAWLSASGAILIAICFFIAWLTFRENPFAAIVVKTQTERKQTIITTGPYGFVRHPMYAGAVLYFIGLPLLLGSWMGLACIPLLAWALMLRILIEELTLRKQFPEYSEYATRVRYRLVPFIW